MLVRQSQEVLAITPEAAHMSVMAISSLSQILGNPTFTGLFTSKLALGPGVSLLRFFIYDRRKVILAHLFHDSSLMASGTSQRRQESQAPCHDKIRASQQLSRRSQFFGT